MSGRLAGTCALVTAAGAGIGRACAVAFAREGAAVLATDIDAAALAALGREVPGLRTMRCDVRDDASVQAAAAAAGDVDVLLNAAGIVHHGTALDVTDEQWDLAFDLNVRGMHRCIRAVLPGMIARGRGSIVNIASVASSIKGAPNRYLYGATKAAVIGLTKALAADVVAKGVRANAICPGTVQSPSLEGRIAAQADPVAARAAFLARQPTGRFGTPEEVAALAVHLAGDESAFTTGAVHVIDGGWSC
jgi:2-keto-3-deoxy-L-fuconate dehydrogenase